MDTIILTTTPTTLKRVVFDSDGGARLQRLIVAEEITLDATELVQLELAMQEATIEALLEETA